MWLLLPLGIIVAGVIAGIKCPIRSYESRAAYVFGGVGFGFLLALVGMVFSGMATQYPVLVSTQDLEPMDEGIYLVIDTEDSTFRVEGFEYINSRGVERVVTDGDPYAETYTTCQDMMPWWQWCGMEGENYKVFVTPEQIEVIG